jgi:hypothetical protein
MEIRELEAILSENEKEAVDAVKQTLMLWALGFLIITGNLLFNPLWLGPWLSKIWLPAVYLAALVLLLVSKFNRRTEAGRVVFEPQWIRVFPKGGDPQVVRISDVENLFIDSGKAGFFRNPFQMNSFGVIRYRSNNLDFEYHFRLLRLDDPLKLEVLKQSWFS